MNNWRKGEQLFQQTMQNRNYTVVNVASNPDYWSKDIDFIVTSPTTGVTKSFEIKWDSRIHSTNNLYLEISNVHSKNGIGWFNFCQADYLAYGDAYNNQFYIISLPDLKKKVQKLNLQKRQCGQDSIGLLVSLEQIKDITQLL